MSIEIGHRQVRHVPERGLEMLGGRLAEGAAVVISPIVSFFVFRLRAMSSAGGVPDPGLHTSYIWDPRDVFLRYVPRLLDRALQARLGPPAAYLRQGSRASFLVPARLAYLGFGAVPGFFVFRYVLALVATVPAYLLLKRLYGPGAGALAVVVIMSAPVIVTAWGTDFPDSAEVSYLIGGFACLVMPAAARRSRVGWTAAGGLLLALSVWALPSSAILIGASVGAWSVVRLKHDRRWLAPDLAVLGAVVIVVTAVVALASWAIIGPVDMVTTTVRSLEFLDNPAQVLLWHSASWRWAAHDSYLLVLPAVATAWSAVFFRRGRPLPPAVLTIGAGSIAQLVVAAYAQFFNHLEILENHFFSSALWAESTLTLVLVVAELTLRSPGIGCASSSRPPWPGQWRSAQKPHRQCLISVGCRSGFVSPLSSSPPRHTVGRQIGLRGRRLDALGVRSAPSWS